MLNILLVDDEPDLRVSLGQVLREEGHAVDLASDGEAAIARLAAHPFHLVVSDVRLPKLDGLSLLRRIRKDFPSTEVLLMTAYGSIDDAVTAMKDSAVDYLTKPFDFDHLVTAIERIDDRRRARDERARAQTDEQPDQSQNDKVGSRLIGQCPSVLQLVGKIETVADTQAAVLLSGESGTGKELVARMLHERSGRRDKPLVVVNCAAVPPSLIEAELFGHERGAFTGAVKKREGRFKAADGGTLFLDEIGETPLETQAKLLRVLQEGEVVPVGSNASVKVDVRVISATNRDLKAMVAEGRFREDLYYRIKVFDLHLPPLRERRGDLPLLVEQFLREFTPEGGDIPALSPSAWAALRDYEFPGNVRELRHAIQHASILARGGEIEVSHLPPEISGRAVESKEGASGHSLVEAMEQYEKELILRTIRGTGERRQRAAKLLGISRKSLWKKLTKYGLQTRRAGQGGGGNGSGGQQN
jgi:DNA-binding NtrC family response regulator